ncbi:RNA-dependent RNA polymerase [Erysiphe necator associated ourmia-like virus 101]|nr:RNA-dependent RNA polymerase [Erysiphe necator associated ourmia-like virus 101]
MVPSCKTINRELWPDSQHERFLRFVEALGKSYDLPLYCPTDLSWCALKEFCSNLIEGAPHPWRSLFSDQQAGQQTRFSVSFSLFLYRKTIPSPQPDIRSYIDKMSTPAPPCDQNILSFCKDWIRSNMRGWDRGYYERTTSCVLPATACAEFGRSSGGSLRKHASDRWDYDSYVGYCTLSEKSSRQSCDGSLLGSRVAIVNSGGKWRSISCPPLVDNSLRPLHRQMYDSLSRFDWLLRGDAKASRFKNFHRVEGEVFVSGDYESATDNLNREFQLELLSTLLDMCREVPQGIREHAIESFSGGRLFADGVEGYQRRGQMMGQLLSFPLLCLVNYLTFLYYCGPNVPVRINGDDIVFRATPEVCDRWMSGVSSAGLTLSRGKTLVHRRYFSLNSTIFSAGVSVKPLSFVRARCIDREEGTIDALQSLQGRFKALTPNMGQKRRSPFVQLFLKSNSHTIYCSRRSVTRGLGLRVSKDDLIKSHLWKRELYYLNSVSEPDMPTVKVNELQSGGLPAGFEQSSPLSYTKQQIRSYKDRMMALMNKMQWENDMISKEDGEDEWWSKLREGCSPWGVGSLISRRTLRLIKMTRNQAWQYIYSRLDEGVWGRRKWGLGRKVWVWRGLAQTSNCQVSEPMASVCVDLTRGDRVVFGRSLHVEFAPWY